jgi:3-hydroxyisobutyrate dehydrogenase
MAGRTSAAVLGAGGTMGLEMARNLARAGMDVRAWNRSRDRAAPLADEGVRITGSPAEAAQGADVVLTILADAGAVLFAMDGEHGALPVMGGESVWLQMSTIGEEATERCARLAADREVAFVDAPVLGTRQPAAEGKLVVLASGPEDLADRLKPVFGAIGQRTLWAGPAGAGTRLKLVTNSWILAVVEAGAETIALAEGMGLDPALFFEAIDSGPLDLPYLRMKGKAIAERDFDPSFRLTLAAKDAGLVQESTERRGMDLPLVRAVRARLSQGAQAHGEKDMSATYLTSAPKAPR